MDGYGGNVKKIGKGTKQKWDREKYADCREEYLVACHRAKKDVTTAQM